MVINVQNEPLLFRSYTETGDDLNIQLHCYACLDFLEEKYTVRSSEYLGRVYNVFNLKGEYHIYAFVSPTRTKLLAVTRAHLDKDDPMRLFFFALHRLFRKELFQPFENPLRQNKLSRRFHLTLDALVRTTVLK